MQVQCIANGLLLLLLLLLAQAAGSDQPGNHSFLPLIRGPRQVSTILQSILIRLAPVPFLYYSSRHPHYKTTQKKPVPMHHAATWHICVRTLRGLLNYPRVPSPEGTYLFVLVVFLYFHILYLTQAESI